MAIQRDDLSLGEDDSQQVSPFPPPERKVVTQPYDLSLQTLLEQWDTGLLVLPDLQREYVWDDARASRLIESLLLNIPIPVLYFAETPDAKYEVIDGHQRVYSVVRFLKNELALSGVRVLTEYKGLRFHKLPAREQRFLKARTMRAIVLAPESHPNMKYEVFERLNTGSIALNAQELRNSLYRGSFNELLKELVAHPAFRSSIGTRRPRRRMLDHELILRFFALGNTDIPITRNGSPSPQLPGLEGYRPPLKRFLNDYMRAVQNAKPELLSSLESKFVATFERIEPVLGSSAFRVTNSKGQMMERNLNRALFDAQSVAFSWVVPDDITGARPRILSSLADLYADVDFSDSIRLATGDRSKMLLRVQRVAETLEAMGIEMRIPLTFD